MGIYRNCYHFARTILSVPFCPYHFVQYHFVRSPLRVMSMDGRAWGSELLIRADPKRRKLLHRSSTRVPHKSNSCGCQIIKNRQLINKPTVLRLRDESTLVSPADPQNIADEFFH